ncbi:hypothetical protein [Sulfobacillus harzensis]|uniref:Uncharacterized protein n=1 Tax=Sulfobacillus harzensis TaxID=2729629 RepID=A0A7Y0L031_9FIRM|nr:hypothetical protein [Sulfobacillus harzensis]NMP20772.1 hypothetical protein [Sulfobacillus harzensis]
MALGNQNLLSGNYGEIKINGKVILGFKAWTLNYGVNLSQEGQFGTGTPILVPGLNSVTVTVSKLMLYGSSLEAAGIEPTKTLNDIATLPPFTTDLYETLEGGVVKTAINCLFDSSSVNASANAAFLETVTLMGTDVASNAY